MTRIETAFAWWFKVCGFAANLIALILLLATFTPELERLCNP